MSASAYSSGYVLLLVQAESMLEAEIAAQEEELREIDAKLLAMGIGEATCDSSPALISCFLKVVVYGEVRS